MYCTKHTFDIVLYTKFFPIVKKTMKHKVDFNVSTFYVKQFHECITTTLYTTVPSILNTEERVHDAVSLGV